MLMGALRPSSPPPKGRPPLRKCPDDFDVIFVEQGRVGCEAWYRARRDTINRWLEGRGKQRLIDARAAFVAHQRANGQWITRSTRLIEHCPTGQTPRLQAIRDRRKINPTLARHAAQFLRISRNGSYIVSQAQSGDWWVGSRRLSAAQMLDLAVARGFDADGTVVEHSDNDVVRLTVGPRQGRDNDRAKWSVEWSERWLRENGNADYSLGSHWQDHEDAELPTDLQPRDGRKLSD